MHSSQLNFRFLLWLSGAVSFESTAVNLDNQCVKPIFVLMTIFVITDLYSLPLNVAKLRLQSCTFLTKASGYVACYYMYWQSVGSNHYIGFCVLHGTFQIIGYDWEKLGA
jgi:hypothetical protein